MDAGELAIDKGWSTGVSKAGHDFTGGVEKILIGRAVAGVKLVLAMTKRSEIVPGGTGDSITGDIHGRSEARTCIERIRRYPCSDGSQRDDAEVVAGSNILYVEQQIVDPTGCDISGASREGHIQARNCCPSQSRGGQAMCSRQHMS